MKKIPYLFFLFSFLFWTQGVQAKESKTKGIEFSGNIDVVTGWQHDDAKAYGTPVGGQLGWFRGNTAPRRDTFQFSLDQMELDLNKAFGENIRLRADLDFGRFLSGSGRTTDSGGTGSNFELEQAYITLNLKGIELLFGRFNVPIGYYVVDRADNPTISFSNVFNYLTPTNNTGMKLYKSFGSHFDFHVYIVNNLADSTALGVVAPGKTPGSKGNSVSGTTANPGGMNSYSALPSYGARFGFNWGAEDRKSTVGFSYAGGPERFGCHGGTDSCNAHLTHLFDLDFAAKITPSFLLAGEFVYRQDNSDIKGIKNDKAWGGFLVLNYDFNSQWRIFGRGGFLQDRTGFYTGTNQNLYDFALGAGYQIAEGAKMKVEYSPTFFDSRTKGVKTSISHGLALEFAYNF